MAVCNKTNELQFGFLYLLVCLQIYAFDFKLIILTLLLLFTAGLKEVIIYSSPDDKKKNRYALFIVPKEWNVIVADVLHVNYESIINI